MTQGKRSVRRLLVICDVVGATQQISFGQPLTRALASGEIALEIMEHKPTWVDASAVDNLLETPRPDVLFLSRYTSGSADVLISRARALGIPVVFHIDDDLLNVPESLGRSKFEHYNQPERLAALRRAMDLSDLVYASTPALAEALQQNSIGARVVAGDIYCSVDPDSMRAPLPSLGPVIGYMATGGHGADMEIVIPAISRLMTEIPELRFETFGTIGAADSLASRFGSRVSHHRGVSPYAAFLDALCELGWWVGIAPLEDTAFNRCKADTKWVEYSFAGMPTVASDLPVYAQACVGDTGYLAKSEDDWYAALRLLVVSRERRDTVTAKARDHLRQRYSRDKLERQLFEVIDRALASKPLAAGTSR